MAREAAQGVSHPNELEPPPDSVAGSPLGDPDAALDVEPRRSSRCGDGRSRLAGSPLGDPDAALDVQPRHGTNHAGGRSVLAGGRWRRVPTW